MVYSLYGQAFKEKFHDNYPEILLTKDMTPDDAGSFQMPIDYSSVMKKAIEFSDGIICNSADVDASLPAFARQKGISVLESDTVITPQAINDFYNNI